MTWPKPKALISFRFKSASIRNLKPETNGDAAVSPGPGAKQRPQQTPKLTNLEAEGPDVQKFQPNLKIAEKETTQKKGKAGAESPSQTSFAHVRRVVLFQEIASLGEQFQALAVWPISSSKTSD